MSDVLTNTQKARFVFDRHEEIMARGHERYCRHASRLEDFYLGGGLQWDPDARAALEGEGRPAREVNQCLVAVNTAAGYQIANRVDIGFQPRGRGADEQTAKCVSKVLKQQLDNTGFRFVETDQFLDGLIQQRGYYDLRMSYDDSEYGELSLDPLDPLDVLPDPDAKHYDPDRWADVLVTRWLTKFELEQTYGKAEAEEVVARSVMYADQDNWGEERGVRRRSGFGDLPQGYGSTVAYWGEGNWRRYRVLDRQSNEYVQTLVGRWPGGDFRSVEGLPRDHIAWLLDHGVVITKRRMRRVRWEVVAPEVTIRDQLSPYEHFTVIPYFPYFRRGRTIGMLDNAIDPQEVLNKFVSQFEHIVNTTANSGWMVPRGGLVTPSEEEFPEKANQTGLVIIHEPNKAPQKIQPNRVPEGTFELIQLAHNNFRGTTGVDENISGMSEGDLSGVATQARQFAAQQKLALAQDNLKRTRLILARNALSNIQRFMLDERIFHITEMDEYGVERRRELPVNVPDGDGGYLNDLTIGEYDITVSEQPMAVTFDNSHFEQIKTMRLDMGVAIPDSVVLRYSTLPDKEEIAKAIAEAKGAPDPEAEANAILIRAKARLAEAQAVSEAIKAQYSAIQTAQAIVVTPAAAALADALLRSGGYQDQDAAPIVPEAPAGLQALPAPDQPQNTHPLSPANADVGLTDGMSDGPINPPPRSL